MLYLLLVKLGSRSFTTVGAVLGFAVAGMSGIHELGD